MEWSIQELARAAGTTSRTLRHYDQVDLLKPSRVGRNGYRYYDQACLVRLQQILLLRTLGLGLPAIGRVLDGQGDPAVALREHLALLERERVRLDRVIESVRSTLRKIERGEQLVPQEVFDGFDHTQYEQEVTERWGRAAWEKSDRWWRSLREAEREAFHQRQSDIARDFAAAHAAGMAPESAKAQAVARRHCEWLSVTGTPTREYLLGLGEMYVADPRFRAHYDRYGAGTAEFVRDALRVYAERHLNRGT
ncbi:MAG TPA: MerR family transcriptional regulator [Micromonosporaceae bacterium]